jgi:hypothetical protein
MQRLHIERPQYPALVSGDLAQLVVGAIDAANATISVPFL